MRHFSLTEFGAKAKTDLKLFGELFSNYLTESEIPQFKAMIIKTYELAKELYEETNVAPQVANVSLRSKRKIEALTENEIKDIVYNSFRSKIVKDFSGPLESGKLLTLHENDVEHIIKVLVKSDSDLDPEISKKYGIFEKVVGNTLREVILPNDSLLNMKNYAEKVDPEYFSAFDRNMKCVKEEFNDAVNVLVRNLALKMFKAGAKFAEGENTESYNFEDYKGISELISDKDPLDEVLDKVEVTPKTTLDTEDIESIVK